MGFGVCSVIVHRFHGNAKPDLETIRDPLRVSVVQCWLSECLASPASLVPDYGIVSFATIQAYGEGDQLA
jgi:hypothetical protein